MMCVAALENSNPCVRKLGLNTFNTSSFDLGFEFMIDVIARKSDLISSQKGNAKIEDLKLQKSRFNCPPIKAIIHIYGD